MPDDLSSPDNPPPGPVPDQTHALEIARRAVAGLGTTHDFVIVEERTQEWAFGWVFSYTTRRYLETGDRKFIAPGNGPLIVERATGATEFLPTAGPPSATVAVWERAWRRRTGR